MTMPRRTNDEKMALQNALCNAKAAVVLNGTRKGYIAGIVRVKDRQWFWLRFPDGDRGYSYLHLDPL